MNDTVFLEIFGNTARTRILDFFILNQEFDYSLTDIAKYSEVSWSTVNAIIPQLLALGLIVKTRNVGRSTMYSLDMKNPVIKHLLAFDLEISYQECKKEVKRQKLEKSKVK